MSKPSSGDIRSLEQTVFNHPLSVASLQVTVPSDRAPVISIGWWCIWTWFLPWICPPKSWPFEWIYHDDWPLWIWRILTYIDIYWYWHIYIYMIYVNYIETSGWNLTFQGPARSDQPRHPFNMIRVLQLGGLGQPGVFRQIVFKVIKQGNHGMLPWKSMKYGGSCRVSLKNKFGICFFFSDIGNFHKYCYGEFLWSKVNSNFGDSTARWCPPSYKWLYSH